VVWPLLLHTTTIAVQPSCCTGAHKTVTVQPACCNGAHKTVTVQPSCSTGAHKTVTVQPSCCTGAHKTVTVQPSCCTGAHKTVTVQPSCCTGAHKTVTVQHALLHWCLPQLTKYSLSCCTGVYHNCHGIACPFALVHTTTLTVELLTMPLHDTNLSFSRNYFTWFEYQLQA